MTQTYAETKIDLENVSFSGLTTMGFQGKKPDVNFRANIWLTIIREAWDLNMNVEDVLTTHGDWSFIRDAEPAEQALLAERALNHLIDLAREGQRAKRGL